MWVCKKYSTCINCIYILFCFTCNRNYFKWFCSRNSYAYGIYGAFIAEVIRAGILSVAKGQMEARSSGLTYTQAMYHVVLPQAMKIVIPPLGNQFLNLVKTLPYSELLLGRFNVSRRFNFNEDVCYV